METINFTETFKEINGLTKYDSLYLQKCKFLTYALIKEKITIRDIVQQLGTLLVNTSIERRELGTLVLSEVLEQLPSGLLDSTDLYYISTFYSDRMKENHQVIPAILKGFAALSKMKNLPEGSSQKLLRALFQSVACQQQQKQDRQCIYEIFIELVNRKPIELKSMGLDFVLGVIQAIDGERNSNNLLLLFNWIPKFLRTVNLSHLTEEMFLVLECYFPVDFQASAQDGQNIMREDLAEALCQCLCAIPEFGQFCIPLIIDKLNSSLKIAKLDSVKLLTESCKTFETGIYEAHFNDLISCLQSEIINPTEFEIETCGLLAITSIIRKMSESDHRTFFKENINNLYDTLKVNIRPDTKLFGPTVKIILAVSKASCDSCNLIMNSLGILLINQFKITSDHLQQETLLKTLMEFVVIYIEKNKITDITTIEMLKEIPTICLEAVLHKEPKMRILGYESISQISVTIPHDGRMNIYEFFRKDIVQNKCTNERLAFLKCFETIASIYSAEILENVLSSKIDENNLSELNQYLQTVCIISSKQPFTDILIPKIIDYCTNYNLEISKISFRSFRQLLEDNYNNDDLQNYLYKKCEIIKTIISWISGIKNTETDVELLKDISVIIKLITGYQSVDIQEVIVKTYLKEINYKLNGDIQDKFIIILEGFILRLKPEVRIPNKYELINELVHSSSNIANEIYLHACQIIANILNKSTEDEYFQKTLTEIEVYIMSNLENNSNKLHVTNIIDLFSWITKALIVKGYNMSNSWTDQLVSLLDNYKKIGKSFKLIMDDSQECLSTRSYCINRLLYRQKFFAYVCKKLSSTYDENKPNHLVALGYLLQLAPQQVVILYFREILRLLVFCLEQCTDGEVLCAVLNTLCTLIISTEPYLEGHIDDLMPRFLRLTKFEYSMKVRIAALKCVQELASAYPVYKLLPHKQTVIFGLTSCLDDNKRLVRRQAVETRSTWFLLDSPT